MVVRYFGVWVVECLSQLEVEVDVGVDCWQRKLKLCRRHAKSRARSREERERERELLFLNEYKTSRPISDVSMRSRLETRDKIDIYAVAITMPAMSIGQQ
jgi:hypothetical protein